MAKTNTTTCAWCLTDEDSEPAEGESHGICQPHADQVLTSFYWEKLQNVPSYAERFANGTERFDEDE